MKPRIILKMRTTVKPSKTTVNHHIFTNNLQTEQRLFVIIDDYLSKITGFEEGSVCKITAIHEKL